MDFGTLKSRLVSAIEALQGKISEVSAQIDSEYKDAKKATSQTTSEARDKVEREIGSGPEEDRDVSAI